LWFTVSDNGAFSGEDEEEGGDELGEDCGQGTGVSGFFIAPNSDVLERHGAR
jgi:hypothetical protein